MRHFSKSEFKHKALKMMRSVQETGRPVIITDHGKPVLELKPYVPEGLPLERLKGSVIEYIGPCDPVADDDK